jgi:type I restriction enzyme S subunit
MQMNFTPAEYETYRLEPGDILLNEGQSLELVGRPAKYQGEVPGACFQNTLVRFRAGPGVLPDFALIVFRTYLHTQRFQRIARWTTNIAHLGADRFASLEFPVPPLSEQRRIVSAVEEQLSDLDAAVEDLKRAQSNVGRYSAAVLRDACAGRLLDLTSRASASHDADAAEFLKHALRRDRLAVAPDVTGLGFPPPGWAIVSLDQITSRITSGSRDWSKYYGHGSGTFLMAQNVRPGRLDLSFRQPVNPPTGDRDRDRSQVREGDVLVTIVGANTGDVCVVPRALPEHYVCQSVALVRPTLPELGPWIAMYLASAENGRKQFERYIYGAGRPHLSFDQLRMTAVLLPPLEEQRRIIADVDRRLAVANHTATEIDVQLARATRLRQAVLKRAYEGRLVAQDPNDEPASLVLKRVAAERNGRSSVERAPRSDRKSSVLRQA